MKTALTIIYPFLFLIIPMLQLWYKNYSEVNVKIIYRLTAYFAVIYTACYLSLYKIYALGFMKTSLVCLCLVCIFYKASFYFKKIVKSRHFISKIICPAIGSLIVASPFIVLAMSSAILLFVSKALIYHNL